MFAMNKGPAACRQRNCVELRALISMIDRMVPLPPTVYESVYRCSPVAEYLISPTPDFFILSANDTFLAASGRTRDELLGKSVFVAFPAAPDDSQDTGVSAL